MTESNPKDYRYIRAALSRVFPPMLRLAATSPAKVNEPRTRKRKSSHGFPGVRGGQGRCRTQYQACLPGKEKMGDLFDTPEEAAADYLRLEQEKRKAMPLLPDYSVGTMQPAHRQAAGGDGAELVSIMPSGCRIVGIGRSMWPLPVGGNPNSYGCEVVVAQLLGASL